MWGFDVCVLLRSESQTDRQTGSEALRPSNSGHRLGFGHQRGWSLPLPKCFVSTHSVLAPLSETWGVYKGERLFSHKLLT